MMPADAVRIDYVAPAACPSSGDFQGEVADRAPHARFADTGTPARMLVVRISARRGGYHGSLVVREIDGTEAARSVDASTCPQVATGLALIAALAVDSKPSDASTNAASTTNASSNGNGNGNASANSSPSTSTSTNKPGDAAAQNAPEKKPDPRSQETSPQKKNPPSDDTDGDKDVGASSPRTPHAVEFSFGIDGGLVGGMSPNVLPTLPVFVEIGRGRGHGIFTPSVRARFERPGGDAAASSQGSAHFTWTEGSIDLCPIAYAPIARVRLVPCVRTEAGIVDASGSGATPTREETRPWLALGLVARARVDIVGPLFGEIEGSFGAPLVRDRFYLEPDFTVFRASAIAWSGAAGLGVTIW